MDPEPLTNEDYEAYYEVTGQSPGSSGLYADPYAFRAAIYQAALNAGTSQYEHYLDAYRAYAADGANPSARVAFNRAAGVQDMTRAEARAMGIQSSSATATSEGGDCGCSGTQSEFCAPGNRRTTQLYPATRVPKVFRMTHMRVKGYHCVYLGQTKVADFTRKASANAFCRTWNEMMKHLGSAMQFDIPTLANAFYSVIDGGSGAWGLKNGFDPPMHGTGGTPAPV